MLRVLPNFSIPFEKFIPSYQYVSRASRFLAHFVVRLFSHHFGYQCKVQAYGFSRLIDLLEELSSVVQVSHSICTNCSSHRLSRQIIEDKNGEKIVQLTNDTINQAIALNIEQLIRRSTQGIKLTNLAREYLQMYRYELQTEDVGAASVESLLLTMTDRFHVSDSRAYE
jgi:hypothetical protein